MNTEMVERLQRIYDVLNRECLMRSSDTESAFCDFENCIDELRLKMIDVIPTSKQAEYDRKNAIMRDLAKKINEATSKGVYYIYVDYLEKFAVIELEQKGYIVKDMLNCVHITWKENDA